VPDGGFQKRGSRLLVLKAYSPLGKLKKFKNGDGQRWNIVAMPHSSVIALWLIQVSKLSSFLG
ncbi:hypothetical protein, partial [Glutamicibacter arilaitensis]|uniref:hypothetical protein n=1 Tax=Glutamicibacter arilaitensis TaxID=256701 RepID=UPI003F8FB527